jgi:UDPglucose 6-dehydrogenase
MARDVAVIGVGYVGLTTAVCLAKLGHQVQGLDVDSGKLADLSQGRSPIFEPELDSLLREVMASGNLTFTNDYPTALANADFIFLCVPTPQDEDGSADLRYVLAAAREAAPVMKSGAVLVTKSTVPVGSAQAVAAAVGREDIPIASNPEFLREGSAVRDFLQPDRIVVGAIDPNIAQRVVDLYTGITAPTVITSWAAAELIKYASNAFLATKLSFVNDLAALCAVTGADVGQVMHGMGLDSRIGDKFLTPGPGWGGSCFPKDTRALAALAEAHGVPMPMVTAAISSNARAHERVVDLVASACPGGLRDRRIACWGLAFKANTDDVRDSPSLAVIRRLVDLGAHVVGHDPAAKVDPFPGFVQVDSLQETASGSDVIVVLTEWLEYAAADPSAVLKEMRSKQVVDARRILDADSWRAAGASLSVLGGTV